MSLELRYLGGLSVQENGRPLASLKPLKGQALLCYLALTRQPQTRSTLAGLLWPDMPEANALTNLRKVIYRLDGPLAGCLRVTRQHVAFSREAGCWIDVEQFEHGIAQPAEIAGLEEAVALYRGEFLHAFDLAGAPAFEAWVLSQRARLHEAALNALQHLATHFEDSGEYEPATGYARQLLALEPWHERGHRALMRLLALAGRRSAALKQYETCRAVLAEELGVVPGGRTVALYEAIKEKGFPARRATTPVVAPAGDGQPARTAPPHNLPAQAAPLIGREAEQTILARLLARADGRLITIAGAGGSGKTRLALAVAAQQVARSGDDDAFADGVYFLPLAPVGAPDEILPRLAQMLGLQSGAPDRRAEQQRVLDFLQGRQMLLVFDNFEHLLKGAGLVAEILAAAPRVYIMTTSREPLRLYEEQVFPLEGLSYSAGAIAATDDAVQLFLQRAQWVQPDYRLQEADIPHLTAICEQTGGMPLALEMAAAWMDTLPLAEIARQMADSLDLLHAQWRHTPARHRNMRAVFDVSWQRLSPPQQQVFARLSVFRGGFTRDAARQVTGPDLAPAAFQRLLAVLVRKSFLQYRPAHDRYDVHELVRQYSAEKLAHTGAVDAVADRHSAVYCAFLHEHAAHWHTHRQLETLAAVRREAANVSAAWRRALARGEWQRLLPALESLREYYDWNGQNNEALAAFSAIATAAEQQAAQAAGQGTPVSPDCLRVWAGAMVKHAFFTPQKDAALHEIEQSLALLERSELAGQDVRRDKAAALLGYGELLMWVDRSEARPLLEEALVLSQALDDAPAIAQALLDLGNLHWQAGNLDTAVESIQTALAAFRARGDRRAQTHCLACLGIIYGIQGRLEEAERAQREVLRSFRESGAKMSVVVYQASLSYTLLRRGEFAAAQHEAEQSLALCRELGSVPDEGWVHYCLCAALLHSGQYAAAQAHAEDAIPRLRANHDRQPEADLWSKCGQVKLAASAHAEAQALFGKSAALYRDIDYRHLDVSAAGLGYTAYRLQQPEAARRHLAQALREALAIKMALRASFSLPCAALLLAAEGDVARAVELWTAAKRQPLIARSKWFADVAGRELDALAAALPREAAEAAVERGQALDLWTTVEALICRFAGEEAGVR